MKTMTATQTIRYMKLAAMKPGDALAGLGMATLLIVRGDWVPVVALVLAGWAGNVAWKAWLRRQLS